MNPTNQTEHEPFSLLFCGFPLNLGFSKFAVFFLLCGG
jgi:hypothetical protein